MSILHKSTGNTQLCKRFFFFFWGGGGGHVEKKKKTGKEGFITHMGSLVVHKLSPDLFSTLPNSWSGGVI